MKIGTRLLLVLLPTLAVVMFAYGAWALQRQSTLARLEVRSETEAIATALGLAIGYALSPPVGDPVEAILGPLLRRSSRYAIALYDVGGQWLYPLDRRTRPVSPERLAEVMATGEPKGVEEPPSGGHGRPLYSILVPIRDRSNEIRGVLEVLHPMVGLETSMGEIRRRFALNTLTLLLIVTLVVWWLVHSSVSIPMARFVEATRAVGRGDLDHRVDEKLRIGELDVLAGEFNRMAAALKAERAALNEQALQQFALERRLRQLEKSAMVGKLSAGLAHEIAAPLNVIGGRAELLRGSARSTDDARYLDTIIGQIDRISRIVRSLLDFAGRRAMNVTRVDITTVLENAMEFLEPEFADAGVEVEHDVPAHLSIDADGDQLQEILVNLLLNATQAMRDSDPPKRIVVRMRPATQEDGNEGVVVDISDTGPGIPADRADRVFDPFFTTKAEGTGLGLFMCRSIVEDHGGTLELIRDSERGAHFRVTLPAHQLEMPENA
jgi:two-component system, NtrC family, sensor kinase